jgi:hypothetical protein
VRYFPSILADLAWLAAAGVVAWFFPLAFLVVQAVCLTATLVLRKVERAMM